MIGHGGMGEPKNYKNMGLNGDIDPFIINKSRKICDMSWYVGAIYSLEQCYHLSRFKGFPRRALPGRPIMGYYGSDFLGEVFLFYVFLVFL